MSGVSTVHVVDLATIYVAVGALSCLLLPAGWSCDCYSREWDADRDNSDHLALEACSVRTWVDPGLALATRTARPIGRSRGRTFCPLTTSKPPRTPGRGRFWR